MGKKHGTACLGMDFSHKKPEIRFIRPFLPDYIDSIRISGLPVGNGEVDLILNQHAQEVSIHVTRKIGDIDIAVMI